MLRVTSDVETRLHVLQPLHEPMFVAVRSELWVLRCQRIELIHVHQSVVGQNRLDPDATNVIQAGSHQHVRHRALWHIFTGFPPRNVRDSARMCDVDEAVVELGGVAKETAHGLIVLEASRWE